MKKQLLIVGGEGYIGQVLNSFLQSKLKKEYEIVVIDNLLYGQKPLKAFKKFKNYNLLNQNLKNINLNSKIFNNLYGVVILAGLVGDPITKKYPNASKKINDIYIKELIKKIYKKNVPRLLFISTCSNYGLIDNTKKAKENSKLNPLSLYAKSKVSIEKFILKKNKRSKTIPTILRFATAFGLSTRMRFDLTINEFTKDIYLNKKLDVYDIDTWRPYCHVNDFARLIYKVLWSKKSLINYQVYNAGSNNNNFTKQKIVQKILRYRKSNKIRYLEKGKDRRNYRVDFSKLNNKLNFKIKFSVDYGIKEIIKWLKNNKNKKLNTLGNYRIDGKNK